MVDLGEFLDLLRFEINVCEVYVFILKGDVVVFFVGFMIVDFVYVVYIEVLL